MKYKYNLGIIDNIKVVIKSLTDVDAIVKVNVNDISEAEANMVEAVIDEYDALVGEEEE